MNNSENLKLAQQLIPASYVQQAANAAKSREKIFRELLQHKKWPKTGWKDDIIEQILKDLSIMDSNNFPSNCGLGEREGRVFSDIVARRYFRLTHGVGRSGDITENQPKAAGSSLMSQLTNSMLKDSLKLMGIQKNLNAILLPVATGMSLVLTMLALRQERPEAKYVLWSRIDQKSCFKSILTAGFIPVIIDVILKGDELQTNIDEIEKNIESLGADNILCVMTTTSCFAPRACDSVEDVSQLCKKYQIHHIINNAYGLQSAYCIKRIHRAALKGRVDIFVQSTDKNFLVPVGGTIVTGYNNDLISKIGQTYPGRASASPMIDIFITLLSLGQDGYLKLTNERNDMYIYLKNQLKLVAAQFNEKVLETPNNSISLAITLNSITTENLTKVGSMLFLRSISGTRVVTTKESKNIGNFKFNGWGSHCSNYPCPYLTAAAGIGIQKYEIDNFIKKLQEIFNKFKAMQAV